MNVEQTSPPALHQILVDIAAYRNQLVVCEEKGHGHRANLETRPMKEKDANRKLERGEVRLGLCAWR